MTKALIKVEGVDKQYRLGEIGTGSLAHDINRWWKRRLGQEDPYLKIGETNDRTKKSSSDFVWALKDINFEVKQGEVLGVIGRNGAGKSTLLKILSRTTTPSNGKIKLRGRVASLLEVGTGFHPELSGRDNIFLNGTILGMTKSEIRRNFDEIVEFAGVARYIDTPVKRYSSGMYVRLAFAVAAHLESEILIVDEVLAVGDAEFQKKCLGKMGEISQNFGRTILFVSHSMASVQALCTKGLFMSQGRTQGIEDLKVCVEKYLYGDDGSSFNLVYTGGAANYHDSTSMEVKVNTVTVKSANGIAADSFKTTEPFTIEIIWDNILGVACSPNIQLKNNLGVVVMIASDSPADWDGQLKALPGRYLSKFIIPANLLNANDYYLSVAMDSHSPRKCFESHSDIIRFSVWDPMDETSLARGMFITVREDVSIWPALQCSFEMIQQ
jgi:lipopolysaccharide transport system ATP-binding protein